MERDAFHIHQGVRRDARIGEANTIVGNKTCSCFFSSKYSSVAILQDQPQSTFGKSSLNLKATNSNWGSTDLPSFYSALLPQFWQLHLLLLVSPGSVLCLDSVTPTSKHVSKYRDMYFMLWKGLEHVPKSFVELAYNNLHSGFA